MGVAKSKLHEIVDELTDAQAERVLETLGDEPFADEWRDEIARRIAEVESGAVECEPGEEVFARIRAELMLG